MTPSIIKLAGALTLAVACSGCSTSDDNSTSPNSQSGAAGMSGAATGGTAGAAAMGGDGNGGTAGGAMGGTAGAMQETPDAGMEPPAGPNVDRTDPRLFSFNFTADEIDPTATLALGTENAFLDTRVEPVGKLVVYLHGAGAPTNCGGGELARVVAGWGFHWFAPCYVSDYGVGNCGNDIGGCRLEAFEGVDHHDFIDITPPDSAEQRVVEGLKHLQSENPEGDWEYYLDGDTPRWSQIIISGSSHGASSSGLVGMHREVYRVVMLAGPLDTNQAWLEGTPVTPIDRYYGFTHTADDQHQGHLAAFETLGLLGGPAVVDGAEPPYADSHRLVTSRDTNNGHGAVSDGRIEDYWPVWQYMYGP